MNFALNKIAELVKRWDDIVVVGHYDADGIAATAILVKAFVKLGREVDFINLKQLYSDDVDRIQNMGEHFIFADFGAGQIPILKESFEKPFVIIDHHVPAGKYDLMLNPSQLGALGHRDISGAGLAYLLAKEITNVSDMAKVAIVGAVGDMQITRGRLVGINREILVDAIARGDIFAYKDLALYGRVSRPLPYVFMFSTDPILPGLTANEAGCFRFLERAGIDLKDGDTWRTYIDLTQQERRKLFSALSYYLLHRGWSTSAISALIGEVYDVSAEDTHSPLREVREFSTLLNATGRHGQPEVGVYVCMGDRGKKYAEALHLWEHHKRVLREGISWVLDHGVDEMPALYFFHARNKIPFAVVGIVAGMVYGSGLVPTDKPIVAFAYEESGWVKVSARATRNLIASGVDLSAAVRSAAAEVGGEGGGHKPAAGARIPRGTEWEFLEKMNAILEPLL